MCTYTQGMHLKVAIFVGTNLVQFSELETYFELVNNNIGGM